MHDHFGGGGFGGAGINIEDIFRMFGGGGGSSNFLFDLHKIIISKF